MQCFFSVAVVVVVVGEVAVVVVVVLVVFLRAGFGKVSTLLTGPT